MVYSLGILVRKVDFKLGSHNLTGVILLSTLTLWDFWLQKQEHVLEDLDVWKNTTALRCIPAFFGEETIVLYRDFEVCFSTNNQMITMQIMKLVVYDSLLIDVHGRIGHDMVLMVIARFLYITEWHT